jgi:hypothetical protein
MPYLIAVDVTVLPVAAVLFVALAGRRTGSARPIMLIAVTVQTVALALGLLAWVATIGHSGRWLSPSPRRPISPSRRPA